MELLTVYDTAKKLGVSAQAVRDLIKKGKTFDEDEVFTYTRPYYRIKKSAINRIMGTHRKVKKLPYHFSKRRLRDN